MNATLPDEPSVYPYTAFRSLPARSVLVLAPHPDDEVLGCGGLIAAWLDAGVRVRVAIVSDGGQGGDAATREREALAASLALAAGAEPAELQFWRLPDRGLVADAALVDRIARSITASGADCVLAPSLYEVHPDHRAVALAASAAFAAVYGDDRNDSSDGGNSPARLAFYEVGHPLPANTLVDITPVLARKQSAIACFGSQLAVQPYDEQLLALNRFRSYTLGLSVSHAEAYQVLLPSALRAGPAAALQADTNAVLRRLGLQP